MAPVASAGMTRIRARRPADNAVVARSHAQNHSDRVARLGTLERPLDHPGLLAEADDDRLAGLLTYVLGADACEILTLHTVDQWRGTGTAFLERALTD